jgi:hypothetical protein
LPEDTSIGAVPLYEAKASRLANREMSPASPITVAAMNAPTPKSCVRDVPVACTAAVSRCLVSRIWSSARRRSSSRSAASSRRACCTAPDGVTCSSSAAAAAHRLVQAVTRQEMGKERTAAWRTYADLLVHALRPYPPFPIAPQYEWAFTHLRIQGAHLWQLLREGHAPEEPVSVNRFVALTDFVASAGADDVETSTDFEYAYECAWRLSLALH